MLIACLGDIHGNLPALNAVLRSIDDAGIQTILNTGDAVVGFPWPNEVIERLQSHGIPSAQGEMDRLTAAFLKKGDSLRSAWGPAHFNALQWTYEHTRSENLEWLRGLPKRRAFSFEGIDGVLCHGAPSGPQDELHASDDEARFLRQREIVNSRIVVCGRTHEPFARQIMDTLFVNPGSVGMPPDEAPRAVYAVIDTETDIWTAEPVWVEYDFTPVQRRLDELGLERP